MMFNGKNVLSSDDFALSSAQIGDYVEQAVVVDAMDCLPPACMGSRCSQMGEPCGERADPDTGEWRMTYHTFKKVGASGPDEVWQYCGRCFCGENVERGVPLILVDGEYRDG